MKKKLLSAVLVTTMLFLSACNSTASSTTKANNEPGKTSAETSADASETTKASENDKGAAPDSTGKYTYTVYAGTEYETKLTVNINIDEYLLEDPEWTTPFLSQGYIWQALGWKKNEVTWEQNSKTYSETLSVNYDYGNGTQMVWRFGDAYTGKTAKDNPSGYPQIYSFNYHLAPISDYEANSRTDKEIETSHKNYGVIVQFVHHPQNICYHTSWGGKPVGISRDDAIIIAWVLSSAINQPGENPFVGTNLEKTLALNSGRYLTYVLP